MRGILIEKEGRELGVIETNRCQRCALDEQRVRMRIVGGEGSERADAGDEEE